MSRGLITAIHNNIPHNISPLINSSSNWQSITIEITVFKSGPYQLINTDVSPIIQQATNTYKHYLIAGDLNANTATWGSKKTRPGQHVQQQIIDCDAILLNDPEVPNTVYGSTLNLVIASPEEVHMNSSSHHPNAKETAPWRDRPLTIIIENKISKTQDPQGAFTEASERICSLNRHRAAINIYIDASVH